MPCIVKTMKNGNQMASPYFLSPFESKNFSKTAFANCNESTVWDLKFEIRQERIKTCVAYL